MHIETFEESIELSSLRETLCYTRLRPYIHARLAPKLAEGFQVREEGEARLTVEDRYFLALDVFFGQLFRNCKTRLFWKQTMAQMLNGEVASCLAIEALEKTYLEELVVLFERLSRFTCLLRKALSGRVHVDDLEMGLLDFFDPLLFDKRNLSQHRLYVGFPQLSDLQLLEEQATDPASLGEFYTAYGNRVRERLDWFSYTERKVAVFLRDFLDVMHEKLIQDSIYLEPRGLPPSFSVADRLDAKIRSRYDHERSRIAKKLVVKTKPKTK